MSQYILILIWLGVMWYFSRTTQTLQYEYVMGRKEVRTTWFFAILVFVPVLVMATFRGGVGDTGAYIGMFKGLPNNIGDLMAYLPNVTKDKGFTVLGSLIKIFFSENDTVYLFILALVQSIAVVSIYRKYSTNYMISIFLFIASTDYISWMFNGLRQFTAVSIIFMATPLMLKRRWVLLFATILLAATIHGSALLMIPVVILVQGKAWNKKTILFTIVCIVALMYADQFTDVLNTLLADTQYTNVVSDWQGMNDDGTNIIRVLVYSVPTLLSFIGRKWLDFENNPVINLCTNMSIVSTALYLVSVGTSGIFIGRLPIYASLYGYILLPYLIDNMFSKETANMIKMAMVVAYLGFYYYQMHLAWAFF